MKQPLELIGRRLAVQFTRQGDRLGHVIWLCAVADTIVEAKSTSLAEPAWQPLLASVEGSPDDHWPASPPLQELHIERRGDTEAVALGVGMAGSSHWSLSVALAASGDALDFDLACRLHAAAGWLGSSYRASTAVSSLANGVQIESANGTPLMLSPIEHASAKAQVTHTNQSDGGLIQIAAANAPAGPGTTIRWAYRVGIREATVC